MASRPVVFAAGALLSAAAAAQAPSPPPTFAAPIRLMAGTKFLGEQRLYPSPVFHDVDGDGHKDLVIGDLRGHMTVALRVPGDGTVAFAAETRLKDLDGNDLDFHNW